MSKPQVLVCGTIVHAHDELKNDLGSVAEILVGSANACSDQLLSL
jgi:hypothetical protein